jgi:hypothetical protein
MGYVQFSPFKILEYNNLVPQLIFRSFLGPLKYKVDSILVH